MKQLYTTKEVANYCGVKTTNTIQKKIKAGELKGFRGAGGRNYKIRRNDLIEFMKSNSIPVPGTLLESKYRILIIDDDYRFVEPLEFYLQQQPTFEVHLACNGFHAGYQLKSVKPHLILLDIMLGDVDGRELIKVIRNDSELGEVQVIAMSGILSKKELDHLKMEGFDDAISKPLSFERLLKKIGGLFSAQLITAQ